MSLTVALALASALAFGISDYLSGVLSRRLRILDLLAIGTPVGLVVTLGLLPLLPVERVTTVDLIWGAVAGVAATFGILLLLRGFRVGRFGVVSPVSSVGAAGIPVVVGLALGEQPGPIVLTGLLVGIVSIWLVSSGSPEAQKGTRRTAAGLWEGLGAGVMFAAMFLTLSRAEFSSGAWPVLTLQIGSLAVIGLALVGLRQFPRVAWVDLPAVAAVSVVGVLGTLAFIYSAWLGLVSIAAVISAMSPAVTVLLARALIAERFTGPQIAGLVLALLAIVLISLG